MVNKIQISKKLLLHLAIFVAVIGVATLFDFYFENNSVELANISAESENNTSDFGGVYLISQTSSISIKTAAQKTPFRKLQVKSHDKFVQKYHQLRNNQVLKAEVQTQTTPLIHSYHYLVFKNFFFSFPDDDPLIS